jgi:hypothetical protein
VKVREVAADSVGPDHWSGKLFEVDLDLVTAIELVDGWTTKE